MDDVQKKYLKALNPFSHSSFEGTKESLTSLLLNVGSKFVCSSLLVLTMFAGIKNSPYHIDSQDKVLYRTTDGVLRANISKFTSVYHSGTLVDTNADGVADYVRHAMATPRGGGQEFSAVSDSLQELYGVAYSNSRYAK